jgi:branched-chain amino acid transport system ATP-binding protein
LAETPLLELRGVTAGYGMHHVVRDIDLEVSAGTITALIGHNGSGKSTLLKALFGLLPLFSGEIIFAEHPIVYPSPESWRRLGACFSPQGSRVFNDLSALENIEVGARSLDSKRAKKAAIQALLDTVPGLEPVLRRRAETLSGGEKQIVALGMAMVTQPKLLFLDEPSLGLSPTRRTQLFSILKEFARRKNMAIVIAEQKVREVLAFSDFALILRRGQRVHYGRSFELDDKILRQKMLY